MHDARLVSRSQGSSTLRCHIKHLIQAHAPSGHASPQGLAVDEFSGNEMEILSLSNLVDREDVGMIEG
jgi:hypothetical protein